MSRFAPLLALAGFVLSGCPDAGTGCDTSLKASITLTARTIDGEVIEGATGTWEAASGESGDCEALADSLACGWEVEGEITVTVTAEGFEEITETVVVEADECHVVGEQLDVTLRLLVEGEPECPAMSTPSVWVAVEGSAGEALTGVVVTYTDAAGGGSTLSCPQDGDAWACGADVAGSIEVTAVADGHGPASAVVEIDPADCHQTRQDLTLTLDWLPD